MIRTYTLPGRLVVTVGLWELVVYDRGDARWWGPGDLPWPVAVGRA